MGPSRAHAVHRPLMNAGVSEGGVSMGYRARQLLRLLLLTGGVVIAFAVEYVAARTKDNGLEFGAIALFVGCLVAVALDAARDRPEP